MFRVESKIPDAIELCLSGFDSVLAIAGSRGAHSADIHLDDQKVRLKIWSAKVGALKTGSMSLESRLQDASNIRQTVLEQLESLQELLQDYATIVSTKDEPSNQQSNSDKDSGDIENNQESLTAELNEIAFFIQDTVDTLLSLSMILDNPAPHDRLKAMSFNEPHMLSDVKYVQAKYKDLNLWQAQKLGFAISRRRRYLLYRRFETLASNLEEARASDDQIPSTVTSFPANKAAANVELEEEEVGSQLEVMSQTPFTSSTSQDDVQRVPPLPSKATMGPFECPLCYFTIAVKDISEWKKHIFEDLRPYVCLEKDCAEVQNEYAHGRDWIGHMRWNHWIKYVCPVDSCVFKASSASTYQQHVEALHANISTTHGMDTLIHLARTFTVDTVDLICPFCRNRPVSIQQYGQHVGRHMEDLCLFALPSGFDKDDGEDEEKQESAQAGRVPISPSIEEINANAHMHMEQWEAEEPTLSQLLAFRTKALGDSHPDTLKTMSSLASIYLKTHRLEEAERLHHRLVEVLSTELGEDHPRSLGSMDGLVYIYLSSGRLNEAEKLSSHTLGIREAKFGQDDSETLISLTNLASIYLASGQTERAEKLYRYRLGIASKTEKDSIERLVSLEGLACIFLDNNRMDEAKKLYKEMLCIREAGLGDVHPDTMLNAHIVTLLDREWRDMQNPGVRASMKHLKAALREKRLRLERKEISLPLTRGEPTKGDEEKMQEKKKQENVDFKTLFRQKWMQEEEEGNMGFSGSDGYFFSGFL